MTIDKSPATLLPGACYLMQPVAEDGEYYAADERDVTKAVLALQAEVRKLREERDLASNAQEAAELRIVELRAKLARVEALLDWAGQLPLAVLREALQDEPKTVEAER